MDLPSPAMHRPHKSHVSLSNFALQLQPEPVPGLSLFLSPALARTHRYLERERRRSPERAPPSILWVLRGPSTSINTIAVAPPFFSLHFILSLLHFNSSFSTFFFFLFSLLYYIYIINIIVWLWPLYQMDSICEHPFSVALLISC